MKQQLKTKIMRLTTIRINSNNQESSFTKKSVRVQFNSKRAEIITWAIFFGAGVAYFVTAILLAL